MKHVLKPETSFVVIKTNSYTFGRTYIYSPVGEIVTIGTPITNQIVDADNNDVVDADNNNVIDPNS